MQRQQFNRELCHVCRIGVYGDNRYLCDIGWKRGKCHYGDVCHQCGNRRDSNNGKRVERVEQLYRRWTLGNGGVERDRHDGQRSPSRCHNYNQGRIALRHRHEY
jgi:hypothetical protein